MKKRMKACFGLALVSLMAMLIVVPAVAQENTADTMKILLEKIKADKKLLVAGNMELTESEAKDFWPVYAEYQKDLDAINLRIGKLITSYAEEYRADSLTDEKALELTTELVAIQQTEGALQEAYVPKLRKALPMKKVARYLQIENKIRAAVKYELAEGIPLVP